MNARIVLLPLAAACASPDGGEALVGCLDDSSTPIADSAAVPEGFTDSPDAFAARFRQGDSTLTLVDATEIPLAILLGDLAFDTRVERSWRDDGSEIALDGAEDCGPVLRASGVIASLDAGDRLAEEVSVVVEVDGGGTARFGASIPLDDVAGTASPLGLDPDGYDAVTLLVEASDDGRGWSGRVDFQAVLSDGGGPDGTTSATLDPYGTFEPVAGTE